VGSDRAGIGYGGIGYLTAEVRALPLARDHQTPLAQPTFENALSGKYPLGRALYIYVVKKPGQALPPHVGQFVRYVLSRQGQEIVVKDGFGPLPATLVAEQLKLLE
jgi:phosphate transport system substrate-binding protein